MIPSASEEDWQDVDDRSQIDEQQHVSGDISVDEDPKPYLATDSANEGTEIVSPSRSTKSTEARSSIETIKGVSTSSSSRRRVHRRKKSDKIIVSKMKLKHQNSKKRLSLNNGTNDDNGQPETGTMSNPKLKEKLTLRKSNNIVVEPSSSCSPETSQVQINAPVSPKTSTNGGGDVYNEEKSNGKKKYQRYLVKSTGGSLSPFRSTFNDDFNAHTNANGESHTSNGGTGDSASGSRTPIKAVFKDPSKFKKLRSKSDTGVFTLSRHSASNNTLEVDTFSGHESDTSARNSVPANSESNIDEIVTNNGAVGTRDGQMSNRRSQVGTATGQGQGQGGQQGMSFRKRLNYTTDAFNKGFNFKNPWKKALGKRKSHAPKPEELQKSTELISELASGAAAAIILASQFQRDDKGMKRVPVLLEQIRLDLSAEEETANGLVSMIKMKLNYGSGPARLSWTVTKSYRDFIFLHNRLKAIIFQANPFGNRPHIPNLPRRRLRGRSGSKSAAPNAQGSRLHRSGDNHSLVSISSMSSISSDENNAMENFTANMTEPRLPQASHEAQSHSQSHSQSQSQPSQSNDPGARTRPAIVRGKTAVASTLRSGARKKYINPNYISELEDYMKQIFQLFLFRSDVNKIWQFLEVSNMSIRLAPEHSFHGKEGLLYVQSSASTQGWRVSHWRPADIPKMIARHNHKWFLVRHSYLVCVDNITSTNVLEVFLVDSGFKLSQHLITGDADPSDGEDEPSEHKDDGAVTGAHENTVTRSPTGTGGSRARHGEDNHDEVDDDGKSVFKRLKFTIQLDNNERTLRLSSYSEKEIAKWYESLKLMRKQTLWSQEHRFGSFAPVRQNVYAQWLIDARDYYWNLSEAISQAKDVIYIHDWWLSPELYLRRPPQGNQEWRLDRLLKRKAEEGVKIFVIVYRNVGSTIPIDSLYTKYSLLDLHENIYAMRSPNPLVNGTVFWAHHEKICMIDHTIAFLGGTDLCFGRYDTSEHVLADDKRYAFFSGNETDEELLNGTQIWPGKDYSNARVKDFFNLYEPFEDMYDRKKVPRMPWHDIQMMVVGQPARDLSRHFVQRWNFLIRQKRPTRPTPLLLPPTDLTNEEVRQMDLAGTCEVQILRSSGSWSLGLRHTEHSIQNAYLKAIETSEHFVYIENQFFITSTVVEGTVIENEIGDALVERIIRAHNNGENWRAIIVIPLMPGFESQIDLPGASSVRLIMMCQYLSISRGPNSIFGKLESNGINPEDYIQFYSLRKWGKIGPNKKLVTEQLYIHAKILIADDRVAIIGSANINERSMRGSRDSEVASIIRDKHQIDSYMGGKPYKVAKFAHTMRVRLMREHLGIDVDKVDLIDRELYQYQLNKHMRESEMYERAATPDDYKNYSTNDSHNSSNVDLPDHSNNADSSKPPPRSENVHIHEYIPTEEIELHSFNHFAGIDNIGFKERNNISTDSRVQGNKYHKEEVEGKGPDYWSEAKIVELRLKRLERQQQARKPLGGVNMVDRVRDIIHDLHEDGRWEDPIDIKRKVYHALNGEVKLMSSLANDDTFGRSTALDPDNAPSDGNESSESERETLDPYVFLDPLDDAFYLDIWFSAAKKNTSIFRQVFRCQPDDEVTTWKEYKEYVAYGEKFSDYQDQIALQPLSSAEDTANAHSPLGSPPPDVVAQEARSSANDPDGMSNDRSIDKIISDSTHSHDSVNGGTSSSNENSNHAASAAATLNRRKRAATLRSSRFRDGSMHTPATAEALLQGIRGHLVFFPTDWLSREFEHGNWWYNFDRLPPLDIYD